MNPPGGPVPRPYSAVLCMGVPPRTVFGIDLTSWQTRPAFCGIKMLPPGVHLVYTAPVDAATGGEGLGRTGVFVVVPEDTDMDTDADALVVREWDPELEALAPVRDPAQAERLRGGVRRLEFDAGLGPYPSETLPAWQQLTSKLSAWVVDRIRPADEYIASEGSRDSGERFHETHFTRLPVERLRQAFDKTPIVEELIAGSYEGSADHLLGEQQAAFVCFYLCHSFDGLEQWKLLTDALCCSDALPEARPQFLAEFVFALHQQIRLISSEMLQTEWKANFLVPALGSLFQIVADSPDVAPLLGSRVAALAEFAKGHFGVDFEEGLDEDGPVVVES